MTEDLRDRTQRLADRELLDKVRAFIPPRLQKSDADDVTQTVFLRLLLIEELPPTKERLVGLAVNITRHAAIDLLRRKGTAMGRAQDVDELVDMLAPTEEKPTVDEEEQIRLGLQHMREKRDRGEIPERMLQTAELLAQGKDYAEIAKLQGRSVAAVQMDASRIRTHLRKYWQTYAAVAGLGAFIVLFWVVWRRPDGSIGPDVNGMNRPAASTAPAPTTIDDHDSTWFRGDANLMCSDRLWDQCEQDLDNAKKLDPKSEELPDVKQWRQDIRDGRAQDQRNLQQQNGGRPPKPPLK
jgi:DNA-directed RNA polymerase specialized sigma24 family protein